MRDVPGWTIARVDLTAQLRIWRDVLTCPDLRYVLTVRVRFLRDVRRVQKCVMAAMFSIKYLARCPGVQLRVMSLVIGPAISARLRPLIASEPEDNFFIEFSRDAEVDLPRGQSTLL